MNLPAKRKPVKSGIERVPSGDFPRHRKFVRSRVCVVPGCEHENIECCHIRLGSHAGLSQKPDDFWTFPGCATHHREQHSIGETSFAKKYGLDLRKIARALVMASPDVSCREAFLEWEREDRARDRFLTLASGI